MKSMGAGSVLQSNTVTPLECLQYALTRPTAVVITGIDTMPILDQAFQAAATYSKLSSDDIEAMLRKTATVAMDGKFEPFKTTQGFDGTAQHPQWMGLQG
jgi:hypothetical protein